MLTVDISLPDVEEIQKLIQEGTEKGYLSYDEIASGLEEVELTKEQIEDFYTYLADHTLALVEGEKHQHPPPTRGGSAGVRSTSTRRTRSACPRRTRSRPPRTRSSTSPSSRRSTRCA